MARRNEDVFEAIKKLVRKNPGANADDAIEAAQKVESDFSVDDKRSFNARYLLPAKRKTGVAGKTTSGKKKAKKSKPKKAAGKDRSEARQLVLERDQKIMDLAEGNLNPDEAYKLGGNVDEFLDRLAGVL